MVIFLAAIHNLTLIEMEQSSNLISSGPIKGWQISVGQGGRLLVNIKGEFSWTLFG